MWSAPNRTWCKWLAAKTGVEGTVAGEAKGQDEWGADIEGAGDSEGAEQPRVGTITTLLISTLWSGVEQTTVNNHVMTISARCRTVEYVSLM